MSSERDDRAKGAGALSRIPELDVLARLDAERQRRCGVPEVIYAPGKPADRLPHLVAELATRCGRVVVSRLEPGQLSSVVEQLADGFSCESYAGDRLAVVSRSGAARPEPTGGVVGLLAAGTADIPVAEQARVMAEQMGCEVVGFYDVGIAGLHRLVTPLSELRERNAAVIVVVAGMEGALPTVVRGLVAAPVIGVPTSVGYGYRGGGEAALLTMLHSCAPGLTVVNIDNGIGAGATAALIANREAAARRAGTDGKRRPRE